MKTKKNFTVWPAHIGASREVQTVLSLIVSAGLLSAVTLPMIPVGSLGLYLTTLLSPVVFVAAFILLSLDSRTHKSVLFVMLMGAMVILSSIASWASDIAPKNNRDLVESVKYLQFVPYLLAIPFLAEDGLRVIKKSIYFASFFFLIIGLIQSIQPNGFIYGVTSWYLGDGSEHLRYLQRRITITGSNPNTGSVIACFFCIFFFSLYSNSRKVFFLIASVAFFYLSFATQSRTSLIAIVISISIYYLLFHKTKSVIKILFITSGIASVVFLVFYIDLSYIYIGIEQALEGKNNSLNVRFEKLQTALQHFSNHPIAGIGPAKESQSTIIDSEYALIIQRYGIIGIIITASYILYLIKKSLNNISTPWGATLFTFTIFIVITMITNNVFAGYQLMSLVVIAHIGCVVDLKLERIRLKEIS